LPSEEERGEERERGGEREPALLRIMKPLAGVRWEEGEERKMGGEKPFNSPHFHPEKKEEGRANLLHLCLTFRLQWHIYIKKKKRGIRGERGKRESLSDAARRGGGRGEKRKKKEKGRKDKKKREERERFCSNPAPPHAPTRKRERGKKKRREKGKEKR